jgi:hypothetical protein
MTSMHSTPAEGNFCDEHGKAQKLATVSVWTNPTTRQTLTISEDRLGNGQKIYFLSNGPYHSHLLWIKIITPTIQTDNGEGANTRVGKGASESDHKTRKTSPIHKSTKQP